jgi:hypothetical protein
LFTILCGDPGGCELLGVGSDIPKPAYHFNVGVAATFQDGTQLILKRTGKGKIWIKMTGREGELAV